MESVGCWMCSSERRILFRFWWVSGFGVRIPWNCSKDLWGYCSNPLDDLAAAAPPAAPLMRTSSLPTETEEERWRRREMQSLKRLEAKRKRLERRNSMNSGS